jgi:hypothetical protein
VFLSTVNSQARDWARYEQYEVLLSLDRLLLCAHIGQGSDWHVD